MTLDELNEFFYQAIVEEVKDLKLDFNLPIRTFRPDIKKILNLQYFGKLSPKDINIVTVI